MEVTPWNTIWGPSGPLDAHWGAALVGHMGLSCMDWGWPMGGTHGTPMGTHMGVYGDFLGGSYLHEYGELQGNQGTQQQLNTLYVRCLGSVVHVRALGDPQVPRQVYPKENMRPPYLRHFRSFLHGTKCKPNGLRP